MSRALSRFRRDGVATRLRSRPSDQWVSLRLPSPLGETQFRRACWSLLACRPIQPTEKRLKLRFECSSNLTAGLTGPRAFFPFYLFTFAFASRYRGSPPTICSVSNWQLPEE